MRTIKVMGIALATGIAAGVVVGKSKQHAKSDAVSRSAMVHNPTVVKPCSTRIDSLNNSWANKLKDQKKAILDSVRKATPAKPIKTTYNVYLAVIDDQYTFKRGKKAAIDSVKKADSAKNAEFMDVLSKALEESFQSGIAAHKLMLSCQKEDSILKAPDTTPVNATKNNIGKVLQRGKQILIDTLIDTAKKVK